MITLKGKLRFISLFEPVMVGDTDILPVYLKLFSDLNGIQSSMTYSMNSIQIFADETSDKIIEYKNDEEGILILLNNADGSFGMKNIAAYLPDMLQRLNGMTVILSIYDTGISIENDPDEKVHGIYYTRCNNCKIPTDDVKSICKIGKPDCCIFITAASDGFECVKFDSTAASILLKRYSSNDLHATRIGNCMIIGRKDG